MELEKIKKYFKILQENQKINKRKKNKTKNSLIKKNIDIYQHTNINTDTNINVNILNNLEYDEYIRELNDIKFEKTELLYKTYDDITSRIFDEINNVDISKYILPSDHIDCVVTGGGLRGYYIYGSLMLLKKMIDNSIVKVRKFIGFSAGAFLSIFIFSGINPKIIRNINDFALVNNSNFPIDKIMLKVCWELLPENIHELINGKVTILVSKSIFAGKRDVYIDKFESKIHLMKVLHATSYIPFVTTNKFKGVDIDGVRYYDGVFSSKNIINFNNDLPQLVFETNDVNYELSSTFSFKDKFPEFIILKGLIQFEKFIDNIKDNKHHENKFFPFKWIESIDNINLPKSNLPKSNLQEPNSSKPNTDISEKDKIINQYDKNYDHMTLKKKKQKGRYLHEGGLLFLLMVSELFFYIFKK